jgi:hypothetical protein
MLLKKYSDYGGGKKNILTLVLSEKKILNETKNHNPPPFKLNGRSLSSFSATENEQFLLFGFSTNIMIEKYSFECVKFYTSWFFLRQVATGHFVDLTPL